MLIIIKSGKYTTTAEAVKDHLENEENETVSSETVRNVFKRAGLVARIKRKKPLLKAEHRKRRLKFARKYQNWNVEDWSRVIWSDRMQDPAISNK